MKDATALSTALFIAVGGMAIYEHRPVWAAVLLIGALILGIYSFGGKEE